MTPQEVWDYYGTSYRFSKMTGMHNACLANWRKWGYVPDNSQYKLERLTHGELKREVIEEKEIIPPEILAFKELKGKIVKLMFDFTTRYAAPGSTLYPQCGHILVDVLESCLTDAKIQAKIP